MQISPTELLLLLFLSNSCSAFFHWFTKEHKIFPLSANKLRFNNHKRKNKRLSDVWWGFLRGLTPEFRFNVVYLYTLAETELTYADLSFCNTVYNVKSLSKRQQNNQNSTKRVN